MLGKIIAVLIIVGVIFYLGYTYEHPLTCNISNSINQNFGNFLKCNIPPTNTTNTTGYLPNSQIINGSLGNIRGVSNYSAQHKVAVNITKKYNESIKHLVLFTGNSSNALIETNSQEQFSTIGTSYKIIDYRGLYVPIYENISDTYVNGSNYFPSLIGRVVYVEFSLTYSNETPTIQVPYIIKSEKINGAKVFWHLTQDTGISNSTSINLLESNNSVFNDAVNYIIGIYYNGTEILFPTG